MEAEKVSDSYAVHLLHEGYGPLRGLGAGFQFGVDGLEFLGEVGVGRLAAHDAEPLLHILAVGGEVLVKHHSLVVAIVEENGHDAGGGGGGHCRDAQL